VATITPEEGYTELSTDEVASILEARDLVASEDEEDDADDADEDASDE